MRRRWRQTAILGVAAVGLVYWTVTPLKPFQDCIQDRQNDQTYQPLREKEFSIVQARLRTRLYLACAVHTVDAYQNFVVALAGVAVAFFTGTLWWITRRSVKATEMAAEAARDTVAAMREIDQRQTDSMAASIQEAARAATAMEGVSVSMAANVTHLRETVAINRQIADRQKLVSELQLRPYLSVLIGEAAVQDKTKGIRFRANAVISNRGQTPAMRVRYSCHSAILPHPLAPDWDPVIDGNQVGEDIIGPQQDRLLSGPLIDYRSDEEVPQIRIGAGVGLYLWGRIIYEDVFGESHRTDYCQLITWLPDGRVWGFYVPGRNNAT